MKSYKIEHESGMASLIFTVEKYGYVKIEMEQEDCELNVVSHDLIIGKIHIKNLINLLESA